jgi:hypothetical protein
MEFIETEKGKPCALHNGYAYRKYRVNKGGVVTWVCLKEKSNKCKGKLVTKNSDVVKVSDHQCVPDEANIHVKKAIHKAKKRAREDIDCTIPKLFNEELGDLHNRGYEFVTIPQYSSLKSTLYRQRNKAQGEQKDPKSYVEVVLDEDTLETTKGSGHLLADDADDKK